MARAPIDPSLRIRAVELAVSDLDRSVEFYERAIGLPLIARENGTARMGTDEHAPALVLRALAQPTSLPISSTGLFHVAWLHPSRAQLADTVRRVAATGWPLEGASDHGVSEAIYLSDPDGLGIEIYADRPRETWQHPAGGEGVVMGTLPLDLNDLLAQSPGQPPDLIAAGTGIGHVHLKVSDVSAAASFYRDTLGLQEQARLPSAAFLAAGGYHHHIGLNSWQSAGARPAPASAPGLRLIEFELDRDEGLPELAHELEAQQPEGQPAVRESDGALLLEDPDGEQLAFVGR
jgi:catechol 2,3-dioxygenase